VRVGLAIAVLLALTGCSFGEKKAAQTDAKVNSRVERCTKRLLDRIGGGAKIRSYVVRTYCGPFARKGWVYADGTLSIDAHLNLLKGYACEEITGSSGGQMTTIPCDPRPLDPLECALLHYVRKNEVRAYIRKLKRSQSVTCDDGTPLDKLGS
jgi:uncharacterized protein YjhX (UPF0386 family)